MLCQYKLGTYGGHSLFNNTFAMPAMKKRKLTDPKSFSQVKKARLLMSLSKLKYRKRPSVSARASIPLISRDPFPREVRRKLTWNGDVAYRAPGTTSDAILIKLNSLYDPDYTNILGNGQPMYFDQLCSATGPYQNYRVNSWKMKVTIYNLTPDEAGTVSVPLNFYFTQGATSSTDVDTFTELISQGGVQTDLIGPQNTTFAMKEFYLNGSMKDYIPKGTVNDDDWTGTYGTDPAKIVYAAIGVKNANGAGASQLKYYIKVSAEFDATFYARDGQAS